MKYFDKRKNICSFAFTCKCCEFTLLGDEIDRKEVRIGLTREMEKENLLWAKVVNGKSFLERKEL